MNGMIPAARQLKIMQILRQRDAVSVRELASLFKISRVTIRRDLLQLNHIVRRSHGGAMLLRDGAGTVFEPQYRLRAASEPSAKRLIAEYAAREVRDGWSVILDSSSTVLELARHLKNRHDLTVVTNDLSIAAELTDARGLHLHVAGGEVRAGFPSLMGPQTNKFLSRVSVNVAFLGAHAIDEHGLSDTDLVLVSTKQAMIQAASRVVVLADHTKFGIAAFARVCELDEVDTIVTDSEVDPAYVHRLEEIGKLTVARCSERSQR